MLAPYLAPRLARHGIHYAWVIAALTFVTMLATAAAIGMPGVLIVPLEREFGWNAAAISGPMGLRLLLFGLMAPFTAALLLRYGLRRIVPAALVLIVLGLGLATQMTQLWQLWLFWGLLIGAGTGLTAVVLGAFVANRWFAARRGLVIGVLTASNATGQLAFLPLAAWLAEIGGWRLAVAPAVGACALAGVLIALFGCEHPSQLGLPAFGETAVAPPPRPENTARAALSALSDAARTRVFWVLFFTFFVCGLSTNGLVQTHFIPLCQDFGMPAVAAASALAMMGAFDFAGTIGSGLLSDRFDARWLLAWYITGCAGCRCCSCPPPASPWSGSRCSRFSMAWTGSRPCRPP